jgi:tetraacyldisaccharide 4'-kinase
MPRRVPVVSIGNLAMGGRGKTPLTALVAKMLVEAGERPAILSRGYGRRTRTEEVVVVSDGRHVLADLDRSGDEPLMLARHVPNAAVLVHEIRAVAAAVAERALGATVHVLDDGFQHRSLARDVDLVVVSRGDLAGRRIPFGNLRSPVSALADADAVVFDREGNGDPEHIAAALPPGTTLFELRRSIGNPVALEPERPWPAGRTVVAVAGIARPVRFVDRLRAAGWQVAQSLEFPDHHRYVPRDVAKMVRALDGSDAVAVLTTEKDAVRLLPLRPLPVPVAAVPLQVTVEPSDRFRDWLMARIEEVRS